MMNAHRAIRGLLAQAMLSGMLLASYPGESDAQWTQTNGPRGGSIRSFLSVPDGAGGTSLYSGQSGVWRTDDEGVNWAHLDDGLTDPNAFALVAVPNGSGGNDLLVGTANGIFRSGDGGTTWSPSSSGVPANLSIYALASGANGSGGTNLYAGTYLGNLFRSTDNGASWTAANSGMPVGQAHVHALTTTASGTVLAGTGNGIYRSADLGATWTRVFTLYGLSFARNGTTIYAGTSNGVYRSTNDGVSWTAINSGMNFVWTYAMAAIPNGAGVTLFAGAGGVLRSTDNGATWTPANDGLTSTGVYALATAPNPGGGTDLYAGTTEGIFRTTNNGASWTNVSFIVSYIHGLQVTPGGAILAGTENHIFRSSDGGGTWVKTPLGALIQDFAVNPHGTSGVSLFAGGFSIGVLKSTDDGVTWVAANSSLLDEEVNSLGTVPNGSGGTNVIAGTYFGIFVSTNDGGSWQNVEPNVMPFDYVVTPNGSGGHDVFGGGIGGVWRSSDGGMTWAAVGGLGDVVQAMATTGNGAHLFAGGGAFGVYRSTNNGASWTLVNNGLSDLRISSLLSPDGTHLFAGGAGGVYLSSDHGNSWTSVATGLTAGVSSLALSADGSTLVAGTGGVGVWTRPIAEMIGGALAVPIGLARPNIMRVSPNPAIGPVRVAFAIPSESIGRVTVIDLEGRVVRLLAGGRFVPGPHELTWDGRDHAGRVAAPGVYFVRVESEGLAATARMIQLGR